MILSFLILVPAFGAMFALLAGRRAKDVALAVSLATLGVAGWALARVGIGERAFQLIEHAHITSVGGAEVAYHVGVDGMSVALVLLTALLGLVSVLVSRREIAKEEPSYYAMLLGLVAAVIGVFVSLDFVFFFILWEVVLVLMFLLILWWGAENRKYAAMRFLVYNGIASGGLLVAFLLLGSGTGSLDITTISVQGLSAGTQAAVFLLLLFTFAVKLPAFPFHGWLPDAHVQAPTAGSVMLAGILLKLGGYGLLRFGVGILPDMAARMQPLLLLLAFLSILYAAFVCIAQRHLKRLIAFSSIVHMGLVLLGIASGTELGYIGAVYEMIAHGLIAGLLFALAGAVHERTGTFDLARLKGLALAMPRTAWLLVIASLAGMGLPTMAGFVAELLIIVAAFQSLGMVALLAVFGVLLTGVYFILLITSLFGARVARGNEKGVSMVPFAILLAATFLLGLAPMLLVVLVRGSVFP